MVEFKQVQLMQRKIRKIKMLIAKMKQRPSMLLAIKILLNMKSFITVAFENISFHGIVYLVKVGIHIIERVLWVTCLVIAIYSINDLSQKTWERFQTSPTVITMDRNMFFWNTSFPSLTVCPHHRVDENKLDEYIEEHPKLFTDDQSKADFRVLINYLANFRYQNNTDVPIADSMLSLPSKDYLEIIYNVTWSFNPEISSGTSHKLYIVDTVTELGICYSVNSKVAGYNSFKYWQKNRWNPVFANRTVVVHPLDGEVYAQIINLSTSYDVYFHGAREIPEISKQKYSFPETDYATVELLALEIFSSPEAKDLTVSQRRCRFTHEAENMMSSPVYSFNICRMECRMRYLLEHCKCLPHFYRPRSKKGTRYPICDLRGLECVVKLGDISDSKNEIVYKSCVCNENCDNSRYSVQGSRSRIWFLGANLQWGINDYPKMQLKRDVIFGFTDVLVYIGGLAGFFMGLSLLSFTELIYFFTWELMKHLFVKRKHKELEVGA